MAATALSRSWIQARNDVPVEDVFPQPMFQKAWEVESDLNHASSKDNGTEKYDVLSEVNQEISEIINTIITRLNQVYTQAKQYDKASQAFYRLIDMNLRFYRYAEIDQVIDNIDTTSGTVKDTKLVDLENNLNRLLNNLKSSVFEANEEFKRDINLEKEDEDPRVIYLVVFSRQLESHLRYTAKYVQRADTGLEDENGGSGGGINDYYAVIDMASSTDAMNQMEEKLEEEEEFAQQAEERIEDAFEDEVEDSGF